MRFGPFTMSNLNSVSDELNRRGIAFNVHDDQALLAELEAAWKAMPAVNARRGAQYDPPFLFLEVDDAVFAARRPELEALGLQADAEEPDFNQEDYVCPSCGKVVGTEPGVCPKHGVALITWSAHVEAKRDAPPLGAVIRPEGFPRWIVYALLGIAGLALLAKFGPLLLSADGPR